MLIGGMMLTQDEIRTLLDATGAPSLEAALEDQMRAGVLESGDVYSVVTGEPVEPDHPDSVLFRQGLI